MILPHSFFHRARRARTGRPAPATRLRLESLEDRRLLSATDFRLATYNSLNFGSESASRQDEFQIVFQELDVDALVMQEVTSESGADMLLGALNGSGQTYARADFVDGNDTDHAFFYDTSKVQLIDQNYIQTGLREIGEYIVSVAGTQFNIYSAHLKAGTSNANEQQRQQEASVLRSRLANLPVGTEVIVAGDMNIYGASEPAYQQFVGSGTNNAGRLQDLLPPSLVGEWHENPTYRSVHSQSPRTSSFGGGAAGGLDDRFDMILASDGINDGIGLEYVTGSYTVFGNDGQHFNQSLLSGSNSVVSQQVVQALHDASDHLPVWADFQIAAEGLPGVFIRETGGNTQVSESGGTDSYEIVLGSVPTHNVVVAVTPNAQLDIGNGPGNAVNLLFTPASALTAQTMTVSALDDTIDEGTHTGVIQHTVTSGDPDYNALMIPNLNVTIIDNDGVTDTVVINEVYTNPPSIDDNREFIEIRSTLPSSALTDLWLLEIEGDSSGAGTIDAVQDLGNLATGSNGLLLLGVNYDSGSPWGNAVSPQTELAHLVGTTMENGTISFLLVRGFHGSPGDDIDADNDGTIDANLWSEIIDSVGWTDGGSSDRIYGGVELSPSNGTPDAGTRFPGVDAPSNSMAWYGGDIDGSGTTRAYATQGSANMPSAAELTPGAHNFGPMPAGITLAQSGGTTQVTEDGTVDSYTLVLDTVPSANVAITVDPDNQLDLGAGAGVPIVVTFTPSTALLSQTINVAAFDDTQNEGTEIVLISHSVVSSDTRYNGLGIAAVSVEVTDNDVPNQPPTADAGPDLFAEIRKPGGRHRVELHGSGTDADGTIAGYEWFLGTHSVGTDATLQLRLSAGVYSLALAVTDDDGAVAFDSMVVTIEGDPETDPITRFATTPIGPQLHWLTRTLDTLVWQ